MRIQKKIWIVISITIIPIVASLGFVNLYYVEQETRKLVFEELDTIATIQEKRVEDAIDKNHERLKGITSRTQLRISLDQYNFDANEQDAKKITKIITDAKNSLPDIHNVFILNPEGKTLFSVGHEDINHDHENHFLSSFDMNNIQTYSDFHDSHVTVIGPLIYEERIIGILGIDVAPDSILSISEDYSQLGDTGEILLGKKDSNGNAVFLTPLRFSSESHLPHYDTAVRSDSTMLSAIGGDELNGLESTDYRGEPVVSSTRFIDETEWGLVVKMDKSEAFGAVNTINTQILILSGILITSIFISSLFLSKSISNPILNLRKSTSSLATNMPTKMPYLENQDEFGDLARDISALKKTLQSYHETKVSNERFNAIGELASRMAHDMRNPLSIIVNGIDLIQSHHRDNWTDSDSRNREMIDNAVRRMTHQIDDVLGFVREIPPKFYEEDIAKIINNVIMTSNIPPNVKLHLSVEKDLFVNCDVQQIEVSLSNLIINAVQSINSSEGTIDIVVRDLGNKILLEVLDSGDPIPEDTLDKIFNPLFTTKERGTGLGLASVQKIIESHGGEITVQNNPKLFQIILPKNFDDDSEFANLNENLTFDSLDGENEKNEKSINN